LSTRVTVIDGETTSKGGKLIAFGWYGGKFSHLDWLLPLLPKAHHYCEPFGGSAAVLLNRQPSVVETYNDVDGELVNFFRVLRTERERFIEALRLTPFSREEFKIALEDAPTDDSFERARRFFIKARQTRGGVSQMASLGRWSYFKNTSRREMAGSTSRWIAGVEGLTKVVDRLRRVQLESDDALAIIQRYDDPKTLFYCDPPYPLSTRMGSAYKYEMSDDDHRKLAAVLRECRGRVAVSGYRCELLDELYEGWRLVDVPVITNQTKAERVESVWMNYESGTRRLD